MGIRIREARKAAGYRNVEQLAVKLDVGARTVQRWETLGIDNLPRLIQIAAVLGRPVTYFLNGTKEAT